MTVRQLVEGLKELPDKAKDSEVTDVCGNPISEVCFEPDEEDPEKLNVWLDADFIYDYTNYPTN